jgi:hypothetical protein
MKKIDHNKMFPTGINEIDVSKKTIISIITGLKKILPAIIYEVRRNEMIIASFTDVINQDGNLLLRGYTPKGSSLYDLYSEYSPSGYHTESTHMLFSFLLAVAKASRIVRDKTGLFPSFLLNSVYYERYTETVGFLPFSLMEFLAKYRKVGEQNILFSSSGNIVYTPGRTGILRQKSERDHSQVDSFSQNDSQDAIPQKDDASRDEGAFSHVLARILYLFFSKNQKSKEQIIFDIRYFLPDAPPSLSDSIWNALHGKEVGISAFTGAPAPSGPVSTPSDSRIPFARRKELLSLKHSLLRFFARRKLLLIALLLVSGILFYLISDYFAHRNKIDYTAGLEPRQVVELYFTAVDGLKPDVLDSIFFRGAGKEIRNEVSRIYVMSRLENAFGNRIAKPEELEDRSFDEMIQEERQLKIYGLKNLEIQQMEDDAQPVFQAKYEKYLSAGEDIAVHSYREMIYLKQYKDHWYIIRTERVFIDGENNPPS